MLLIFHSAFHSDLLKFLNDLQDLMNLFISFEEANKNRGGGKGRE